MAKKKEKKEAIDYRKHYYCYGLNLTQGGSQHIGDCPFCGKEEHLFVSPEKGLWNCKSCSKSGNSASFLGMLMELSKTDDEDYQELSQKRGIKPETFKHLGLRKNTLGEGECWLIPSNNRDGKLSNLYRAEGNGKGYVIKSGPAPLKQQIYRWDTIHKLDTVYLVEGHWDAMALLEVFAHLETRGDKTVRKARPNWDNDFLRHTGVIASPGASTFNKLWLKFLSQKKVILIYDNDDPGEAGINRFCKILEESQTQVSSLHRVYWRDGDPNDIRDLLVTKNHLEVYQTLQDRISTCEVDINATADALLVEPIPCPTYKELITHYKKELLWSEEIEHTLATMLAVIISTRHEGGQLALRVIGAPGTAKSTLAEAVGKHRELVYPLSKFTGLISGWQQIAAEDEIASKVDGKTLIVKDADTIIQLPNLLQVESELRDALGDGVIRAEYRTGKTIEIETVFTCILCGTKALREMDNAMLGSRFLDIVIFDPATDANPILDHAINAQFNILQKSIANGETRVKLEKKSIPALSPPTAGFMNEKRRLIDQGELKVNPFTKKQQDQIRAMALYIGFCRTKVQRETRGGDLCFRPESELATRLTEQLTRLAIFLAIVYSHNREIKVTRNIFNILQRVTRDTAYGFTNEAIQAIAAKGKLGMKQGLLAGELRLSNSQASYILSDLEELGIVYREQIKGPMGRGRPSKYCFLTQEVIDCYRMAFAKR